MIVIRARGLSRAGIGRVRFGVIRLRVGWVRRLGGIRRAGGIRSVRVGGRGRVGRGRRGGAISSGRTEVGLVNDLDVGTRVGELDVGALWDGAAVADVGLEDLGTVLERGGAGAGDVDSSAVHVHLAVAGVVEPGPGKDGLARLGVGGDGKVEAVLATFGFDATTLDGLDDAEGLAAVKGHGELARATVVCGTIGQGNLLLGACGPGSSRVTGGTLIEVGLVALARKVVATGGKRRGHIKVDGALVDFLVGL